MDWQKRSPRYRARRLTAGLVAALILLATACGTSNDSDAGGGGESGTPTREALRIGYILPESGSLAFLREPLVAGFDLAISEINEAGGVFGSDVVGLGGDEAGDATIAAQSADRLLDEGSQVIVGALASSMSLAIIDKVTGQGVVQCSPGSTSATFTDYEDGGFFFRTAATDVLQGPVLAQLVGSSNTKKVVVLARSDDYGRGLATAFNAARVDAGADEAEVITFDPESGTFDSVVSQARGADLVVLVAFDEASSIIPRLLEAGFGPDQLFLSEGSRSDELPGLVDPGDPNVLDGIRGTAPNPQADPTFYDRLTAFADGVEPLPAAAQVYDCVVMSALAAVAGGSTDSASIAENMVEISRNGIECSSFADCLKLLEEGEDIDYEGPSGHTTFNDGGEPVRSVYEIWGFVDGALVTLDSVESSLPEGAVGGG